MFFLFLVCARVIFIRMNLHIMHCNPKYERHMKESKFKVIEIEIYALFFHEALQNQKENNQFS